LWECHRNYSGDIENCNREYGSVLESETVSKLLWEFIKIVLMNFIKEKRASRNLLKAPEGALGWVAGMDHKRLAAWAMEGQYGLAEQSHLPPKGQLGFRAMVAQQTATYSCHLWGAAYLGFVRGREGQGCRLCQALPFLPYKERLSNP
jgi:hypothetical protein